MQPAVAAVVYFVKAHNPCGTAAALAALASGLRTYEASTSNTFAAAAQAVKDLGTSKGRPSLFSKVVTAAQFRSLPVVHLAHGRDKKHCT